MNPRDLLMTVLYRFILLCSLILGAVNLYQIRQLQTIQAEILARNYEAERKDDMMQKRHESYFAPVPEEDINVPDGSTIDRFIKK